MRINTNVSALQAARNLGNVNKAVASSTEKLSSGFRINKASDDAAGLGIANVMRSDIRAYNQASRNAEQANSVYNIAEGAASAIQNMLERMKELAAQSASDSVDTAGRARIDTEFKALSLEIQRTVDTTKFQGSYLLDGTYGATAAGSVVGVSGSTVEISGAKAGTYTLTSTDNTDGTGKVTMTKGGVSQSLTVTAGAASTLNFSALGVTIKTDTSVTETSLNAKNVVVSAGAGTFLIGASGSYDTNDVVTISGDDLDLSASNLGVDWGTVKLDTLGNAQAALTALDGAISKVNTALGVIGAGQSRIDNAISNLKTTVQNYSAAESVIRDVDMAEEMTKFSKNQILSQAGVAMLAQANQAGQGVLRLLQG